MLHSRPLQGRAVSETVAQLNEFAHRARSICSGGILTLRWALFMGATGPRPFAGECIDVRLKPV